uniref:Uncharacterized protein n=1 Tax=Rhizophora mucronata TaxID=61149 RepID=A0A2P2NXW4_RHIMU
MSVVFWVY